MLALKRTLLCTVIVYASSGCAAMMMRSPKSDDSSVTPRCSESRGGVIIDGLFTAIYGVIGVALLANDKSAASLPFLALGGAHTTSAVAGARSASRCAKAFKAHDEWLAGADARARRTKTTIDTSTGKRGGRCYGNSTCDQGLTCETRVRICVPASTQPASTQPASTQPPSSEAAPTAVPAPDEHKQTGSQAPKPPSAESASKPPASKPAPSNDDINWSDFWREVNL